MYKLADVFEHDGLKIHVEHAPSKLRLRWLGYCDARDPRSFLQPFMKDVLAGCKGKAVTIDFSSFEYMNSATITPIMSFIRELDAQGIEATLLYDSAIDWQRVNFQCMKTIARTMKHVRVEAKQSA